MGVFQRLVFALGHRKHRHLVSFTQIEARRADQVADVFNKQDAVIRQRQARGGVGNHLRIQMAAFAGVNLNCRGAGFADARRVVYRLLVALDHRAGDAPVEAFERFGQQRGFTGTGAGDQVQHQLFAGGKARAWVPASPWP